MVPIHRTCCDSWSGTPHTAQCLSTAAKTPVKTPHHIPTTTTAREILDAIDAWAPATYNAPYAPLHEASKLWSVLTALRGPDSGDGRLKEVTTCVIRHHAMPRLAELGGAIVRAAPLDSIDQHLYQNGVTHFDQHVHSATIALEQMYPPEPGT